MYYIYLFIETKIYIKLDSKDCEHWTYIHIIQTLIPVSHNKLSILRIGDHRQTHIDIMKNEAENKNRNNLKTWIF